MKALFESQTINGMVLSNRFVRSATWAGMADDDGNVTPALVQLMSRLAEGGVGPIITGHAFVDPSGKHSPWQMGVDGDNRIVGLRALAEAVHKHNRAIAIQLGYGGAYLSNFPQITESIHDSQPHPAGARYCISFGLRTTEAGFLPMDEVHMTFPGDNRKHPCDFPPGSRDHEEADRAIRSLSDSLASKTDPPPGRADRT